MDFLTEQTVHRKNGADTFLKKLFIISSAVLLPIVCILAGMIFEIYYFFIVAFFVLLMCIYGVWYFWTSLKIDYEYSFSMGELAVSKIIADRKRKEIVKVQFSTITSIQKYTDEVLERSYEKVFQAAELSSGKNSYAVVFTPKGCAGSCLLLFSPNDKLISAMKPFLKQEMRNCL